MPLAPNTNLGPYNITAVLGSGGMGELYRAWDSRLNRQVAIKVLPPRLSYDANSLLQFEAEAKAVAALSHPNILAIHDFGVENDIRYAVTELLEGQTLRQALARGRLSWRKAQDIGAGIAEGLAAAHSKNILHRDIKPENIFLTSDGRVKILDFGLASGAASWISGQQDEDIDTDPHATVKVSTPNGVAVGTPGYMSPEQACGEPVGFQTDIFSLGCVLYEMITGTQPFVRSTVQDTMDATLTHDPTRIAGMDASAPAVIGEAIARCLEKNPGERFHSARDLAFTLRSASTIKPAVPKAVSRRASILIVSAILVTAVAAALYFARARVLTIDSMAVLPFKVTGSDPNMEYLGDGITDSLIGDLSRLPKLRVLAHSTVYRYKNTGDPRKAGADLNVRALVIGQISEQANNLNVRAELVDTSDGSQLWSDHYERKLSDMFTAQQQIAQDIASRLRPQLSGRDGPHLAKRRSEDPDAYALYLKGRYYWNKRDGESLKKAIDYFQQALEKDPTSALPYAGLAQAYMLQSAEIPPNDLFPRAKAAALKALELDDSLAEAHAALEYISLQYDWNWEATQKEYQRAIELNPSYATAYSVYARYLNAMGRFPEAEQASRKAQQLDPLSVGISAGLGLTFYLARQYDKAIHEFQRTLEFAPNFAVGIDDLATAQVGRHNLSEAIQLYRKAAAVAGGDVGMTAELAYAYALAGERGKAEEALTQVREMAAKSYVPPYFIGLIYTGMGRNKLALEYLEKAYEDRSWPMTLLKVEPRLDSLRPYPGFGNLLDRMRLAH